MVKNNTHVQQHNQPEDVLDRNRADRTDPIWFRLAGVIPDDAERFTDTECYEEIVCERDAGQLLGKLFGGMSDVIRCPRCAWNEPGRRSSGSAGLPYWCPRCRRNYSIKIETVMFRSILSLRQWVKFLHIWTGGCAPSTAEELSRRMGVNDGTARDIILRILQSTEEHITPLREPAEMAMFSLGGNPKFKQKGRKGTGKRSPSKPTSASVVALVGRRTGTTVIRTVTKLETREIQQFVSEHLARGMDLYLSDHSVNQGITGAILHHIPQPEASYLLQDLRERIRTQFITVQNWVEEEHLAAYLAGLQWWENHGHLSHWERMRLLALGMRWKTPSPSKSQRARLKKEVDEKQ